MSQPDIMRTVDLHDEIARYAVENPSGRRSEILVKTPTLRVVLITMTAGTEAHEHAVDGPITVQALTGRFVLTTEEGAIELPAGRLASLAGGIRHAVRAIEDGAFLLTISWISGSGDQE
ncbi:MAG: hypothetical protein KF883_02425 [Thermomicrobiales bacterium]|nr:hypothetical protein [Thermomicrobiales bacterium]